MRKWLLLLLLLPLATGQTVHLGIELDVPIGNFDLRLGTGDGVTACSAATMEKTATAIRFADGDGRQCGSAHTSIPIPENGEYGNVRFEMDRNVTRSETGLFVENLFLQQLRVAHENGTQAHTLLPAQGASRPMQQHETEIQFSGNLLELSWYFEDLGNDIVAARGIALPTDATHNATLQNVVLQFRGLPVDYDTYTSRRPLGNEYQEVLTLKVPVETDTGGARPFLEIEYDSKFSLHNIYGPAGNRLVGQAITSSAESTTFLLLPPSVAGTENQGTYTFEFVNAEVTTTEAYLGTVAVVAFVFPLAGIAFSYREYRHTRYRIGNDPVANSGLTWLWRGTVAVIIFCVVWILGTRRVVGMLYWPPGVEQVLYYSILIGTGAFMFMFMFLWRRQTLMVSLDKEIKVRRRTQSTLEQSNRDLEMFAYVASHDMKQPLRMVKFYTRRLKEKYGDKLDQDARDYIDYASDNAERMEALVQGLLEYSRVDSANFVPTEVDLNDVMAATLGKLQLLLEEMGGKLTWDDLGPVRGNFTQLNQLMQNLVENSIKYCSDKPPVIHVTRHDNNCFQVSDNGRGIKQKDRHRIFQLFKQLDVEHDGEGIGLALCRRIVEKHGGTIEATTNPKGGTIMKFTLK